MESVWFEGKPRYTPIPTELSRRYDKEMDSMSLREAEISKRCPECGKVKPAWEFYYKPAKNKPAMTPEQTKKYLSQMGHVRDIKTRIPECRECTRRKLRAYQPSRNERYPACTTPSKSVTKRCTICKKHKPQTQFYPKAGKRDGLNSSCKQCDRARTKKARRSIPKEKKKRLYLSRYARMKQRFHARKENIPIEKKCKKCGKIKPIKNFRTNMGSIDTRYHICLECQSHPVDYAKEYTCVKCGVTKNASKFGRIPSKLSGIDSTCRECRVAAYLVYRARRDLRKIPLKYGFDYDGFIKEKELSKQENLPN
jgi:hypothetical protein